MGFDKRYRLSRLNRRGFPIRVEGDLLKLYLLWLFHRVVFFKHICQFTNLFRTVSDLSCYQRRNQVTFWWPRIGDPMIWSENWCGELIDQPLARMNRLTFWAGDSMIDPGTQSWRCDPVLTRFDLSYGLNQSIVSFVRFLKSFRIIFPRRVLFVHLQRVLSFFPGIWDYCYMLLLLLGTCRRRILGALRGTPPPVSVTTQRIRPPLWPPGHRVLNQGDQIERKLAN